MEQKLFNKNFSLLLIGQILSSLGTSILRFSISLYILETTQSSVIFASTMAISIIPMILLSPFGGVLADRGNKGKMMMVLDITYATIASLLGVFVFSQSSLVFISVALVLLSCVAAFELPVSQSAVPLIQSEDNLVKSNSIVSQISMLSEFAGPVIAGVLFSLIPMSRIALLCGACFVLAATVEFFLRIPYEKQETKMNARELAKDFKESVDYVIKEQPNILKTMFLISTINLFVAPLITIGIPYMIQVSLDLGSKLNGLAQGLIIASGLVGGVIVGVFSKKLKTEKLYKSFIIMALAVMGLAVAFYLTNNSTVIYIALILTFICVQIASTIISILTISVIQQITPPNQLGRVMSFVVTFSLCSQPIGQILFGGLFEVFSNALYVPLIFSAIIVLFISIWGKKVYGNLSMVAVKEF